MIDPDEILAAIDRAEFEEMKAKPEEERGYIGASEIGHACDRFLWLKFHRYIEREFTAPDMPEECDGDLARMLRLFERGHREEHVLECRLRKAGVEIISDCFTQDGFRVGFFAGHSDGLAEYKGVRARLEYKTHSRKSFATLRRGGLKASHVKHYAQCQAYMHNFGERFAIYVAVCKDDDSLFIDVIPYHQEDAEDLQIRSASIAAMDKPPERISKKPSFYVCKMCSAAPVCFGEEMPRVSCRNCSHADKHFDHGTFSCELIVKKGTEAQRLMNDHLPPEGFCPTHTFNPYALNDLQGWDIIEWFPKHKAIEYTRPDGSRVINGASPFGIPSTELEK